MSISQQEQQRRNLPQLPDDKPIYWASDYWVWTAGA